MSTAVNQPASIGILNVGAGDTKLVFDKSSPADCIRAARIVKDMLRRGYALLIEVGKDKEGRPAYRRALDFDESTCEYIIADFDPVEAATHDRAEAHHGETQQAQAQETPAAGPPKRGPGRPKGARKKIPATSASGVAVARTAGG